jgi:hypothetical protein
MSSPLQQPPDPLAELSLLRRAVQSLRRVDEARAHVWGMYVTRIQVPSGAHSLARYILDTTVGDVQLS